MVISENRTRESLGMANLAKGINRLLWLLDIFLIRPRVTHRSKACLTLRLPLQAQGALWLIGCVATTVEILATMPVIALNLA